MPSLIDKQKLNVSQHENSSNIKNKSKAGNVPSYVFRRNKNSQQSTRDFYGPSFNNASQKNFNQFPIGTIARDCIETTKLDTNDAIFNDSSPCNENSPWHQFLNSKPLGILTFLIKSDVYCEYITPNAATCILRCITGYLKKLSITILPLIQNLDSPDFSISNEISFSVNHFLSQLVFAYENDFLHLPQYNYPKLDSISAGEYLQQKIGEFFNNTSIIYLLQYSQTHQLTIVPTQPNIYEFLTDSSTTRNKLEKDTTKVRYFNYLRKHFHSSSSTKKLLRNGNDNKPSFDCVDSKIFKADEKIKHLNFDKNMESIDFNLLRLCISHYLIALIRQSSIHMVYRWRTILFAQDVIYAKKSLPSRYTPLRCHSSLIEY